MWSLHGMRQAWRATPLEVRGYVVRAQKAAGLKPFRSLRFRVVECAGNRRAANLEVIPPDQAPHG